MNSAISSFQEAFDIKGEVGRLVDIATSETLLCADLQQNLQICDKVNAGGKEACVPLTSQRVDPNGLCPTRMELGHCLPESLHRKVASARADARGLFAFLF